MEIVQKYFAKGTVTLIILIRKEYIWLCKNHLAFLR
jgi:hypothetical protein